MLKNVISDDSRSGQAHAVEQDRFIGISEVTHLIGTSPSWIWKAVRSGGFPQPVRLSDKCARWRLSVVRNWMKNLEGWKAPKSGGES